MFRVRKKEVLAWLEGIIVYVYDFLQMSAKVNKSCA